MYILEQLAFAAVFGWRLERRRMSGIRKAAVGAVLVLLGVLGIFSVEAPKYEGVYLTPGGRGVELLLGTTAFCSILFAVIAGLLNLVCEISVFEAIYTMTCAYMGEHIAFCLRGIAEWVTGLPARDGGTWWLYWGINAAVAFLCYRQFAVPMIYKKHYSAPPRETIGLMFVAAVVIMGLSATSDVYGFRNLHSVYALIFCLMMLYTQVERQKALARQSEADIREQMLIAQKAQYESYRVNTELVNRKCHDLKHQVAALRMMGEGEHQQKVIREIEDSVLFYDSFIKTGNEGLDTILTQKNLLCTEKEILFTCVADGTLLDFMDPVDLFVFFGNLMDNAIEAVQAMPVEKRSIQLSVSQKAGMVMIREENPTDNVLQVEQGRAVTTKEDAANHGFGLRSMEMAAEKYDGSLTFKVENGVFMLSAVFIP